MQAEAASSHQRTTVLVVDDYSAVRESFARQLRPLGYEVRTCTDVSAAHRELDGDVDIALIERQLPDGSVDALLAEIRSRNLGCRVALVTADDPEELDGSAEFDRLERDIAALEAELDELEAAFDAQVGYDG